MLKTKKQKKLQASLSEEYDDQTSLCSEFSVDVESVNSCTVENEKNEMLEALESVSSRTRSFRIEGLKKINQILSRHLHDEFCTDHENDLIRILSPCITSLDRKWEEQVCTCNTIALIALSIPEKENFINRGICPLLIGLLKHAHSVLVEVQAIRTLSFCAFCGRDQDINAEVITLLSEIWKSTPHDNTNPKVITAALQSWTFLMSQIPSDSLVQFIDDNVPILMLMLEEKQDVDIRIAVGECLSLFIAAYTNSNDINKEDINIENIRERFNILANDTQKQKKTDIKLQRQKFRQFYWALPHTNEYSSLSEEINSDQPRMPHIRVRLGTNTYECSGWSKYIQYHNIKSMIGTGFQTQLFENTFLQSTFDFEGVQIHKQSITQNEKRRKKKEFQNNARKKKDNRKHQRRKKHAILFQDISNHT